MISLGRYLLEERVLTLEQLEEATQGLVVFGGRLGSHLVELGMLTLSELERHLGDHTGIPLAPSDWLEAPERAALGRVPIEVVKRFGVLPLRIDAGVLHIAMLDPTHPRHLAAVGRATGLRIQPYVVSEARLVSLLATHLGIGGGADALAARAGRSGPHAAAPRPGSEPGGRSARSNEAEALANARAALGIDALGRDQELIDERTFSSLYEAWTPEDSAKPPSQDGADGEPAGPPRRPSGEIVLDAVLPERRIALRRTDEATWSEPAIEIARLESEIEGAEDRERVNEAAIQLARIYATRAALFVVRGELVLGERAAGQDVPSDIRGLVLPASAECSLTAPLRSGHPYRGAPLAEGLDVRILAGLGEPEAGEICVLPVTIRDRVVSLLVVDNGESLLGASAFRALEGVCDCMARAYQRLILARKRAYC